ncbi:MAG: hypothetical protein ABWK01_06945 [Infirmifilum sp.]
MAYRVYKRDGVAIYTEYNTTLDKLSTVLLLDLGNATLIRLTMTDGNRLIQEEARIPRRFDEVKNILDREATKRMTAVITAAMQLMQGHEIRKFNGKREYRVGKAVIRIFSDKVWVTAPYREGFSGEVKKLGAKWDAMMKTWVLPRAKLQEVKLLVNKFYRES